jgi:hypothetical protein
VKDEERKDGEEARPLPYPLPGGASGIVWERTRPATVEEIERALDNMEDPEHWLQPSAENLAVLVRDAFTILDTDPDGTAGDLVDRLYPVFAGVATYEQRLALIDEAFVRSFADGAWPVSLATLTVLERDPVLIAVCAALYAAHVLRYRDESFTYEDLGGVLAYAEEQSRVSFAATIMGFVALGVPDFLDDLAPFRDDLDDDDVAVICGIPLVKPGLATVVFFLDWMEEAQQRHEHARFAQLAAAVASWGAASSAPAGGRRHCLEADDLRLQVCWQHQLLITRDQLARQIRPRLEALAKSETGSRVIPPVLAAWGVRHKVEAV